LDTTNFSAILERMGVTEMGRKLRPISVTPILSRIAPRNSDRQTGCVTLGIGVTIAVNHDAGTIPSWNEQYR